MNFYDWNCMNIPSPIVKGPFQTSLFHLCYQGMAAASASGLVGSIQASNFNNNKIRFHEKHGSLIKLLNNNRTAERKRPFDEFNNGVVMTHRPIKDNELFEIRLDRLVDKWSGSIEVGLTTHNPAQLDFPATMTNLRAGTTMMSGCGILTNGKGTRREYGQFNLDELAEGDRIGMIRKSNGNLHYFINGLDQGVAASRLPAQIWGVVDLYGMTVKVRVTTSTIYSNNLLHQHYWSSCSLTLILATQSVW